MKHKLIKTTTNSNSLVSKDTRL